MPAPHQMPAHKMSLITSIIKQPLFHFLLIGALIFVAFSSLNDVPSALSDQKIAVTQEKAGQLAASFQSARRRPPTQQELIRLIDDFIREEVLVREAKALSLEQNDVVIRRRLRQKMEFLTDSAAAALKPTEEQLRRFYDKNRNRYSSVASIGFDQVFVGEVPNLDEVEQIHKDLQAGKDRSLLGAKTLLPPSLPSSTKNSVDGVFGRGFFDQLMKLNSDAWNGPIQSGYGFHLVRITSKSEARILEFEKVRDAVQRDWLNVKRKEIAESHYLGMLKRYEIVRPNIKSLSVSDR